VTVSGNWVHDANAALFTDLYQLTMMQGYWHGEMREPAAFTFFCRRLPQHRNYLLACGLDDVLTYLETVRWTDEAIDYLATLPQFLPEFLAWLRELRFTGDVYAVPEGTPVFAEEPILEVVAPIAEAQLIETFLMNQIHLQTLLASKASRVVTAAAGRPVVDFGLRRMHGADAGLKSARAFQIAGVTATSNVLAGQVYGVPISGTMAHSYIQAHDTELDAFRDFHSITPGTILLVDTYDTLAGVDNVIALARELGDRFAARGVRLDSGDLYALSVEVRRRLDSAGLRKLEIFASGGLDEYEIESLLARGAPIDGFGVGTAMGVSADAPSLDLVYKLAEYGGVGRLKTSPGKPILPGRKQVLRVEGDGLATRDVIARRDEQHTGRPLLRQVMRGGKRLGPAESLDAIRDRALNELRCLPSHILAIRPADPPYPVEVSPSLRQYQRDVIDTIAANRP
jgi:nicotinate phosphoribosyltransferase